MLRRRLLAVLVALTVVFTFTTLSAFADEVMEDASPPAQLEAAEQTGELLIGDVSGGEDPEGDVPEGDVLGGEGESDAEEEARDTETGDVDPDVPVQYTVTIHYVDEKGNILREDSITQCFPGHTFSIDTPVIEGYTPDREKIESGEGGMPKENLEYTVTYFKTPLPAEKNHTVKAKADKATPKAAVATASVKGDSRSYELTVIGEEKNTPFRRIPGYKLLHFSPAVDAPGNDCADMVHNGYEEATEANLRARRATGPSLMFENSIKKNTD